MTGEHLGPMLRIARPRVAAQDFDGEQVIVHLGTGKYFSLDPLGSVLWERLEVGDGRDALIEACETARPSSGDAAATVDAFLSELADEDLIETDLVIACPDHPPTEPIKLLAFSDLADVLLVDPIHDLDLDGDGWPVDAGSGVGRPPVTDAE